jgi:TfoX/Sxy family transcriptional regulator of competence genes
MAVAQGDIDRAIELFSGLGDITTRKMMGASAAIARARSSRS